MTDKPVSTSEKTGWHQNCRKDRVTHLHNTKKDTKQMYYYSNQNGKARMQEIMREIESFTKEAANKFKDYIENIEVANKNQEHSKSATSSHGSPTDIPIQMTETETSMIVRAQIPGVEKKDVDLVLKPDGTLKITATLETPESSGEYHVNEFRTGQLERTIDIPGGTEMESDQITASLENGILTVTMPRTTRKGTQINVN